MLGAEAEHEDKRPHHLLTILSKDMKRKLYMIAIAAVSMGVMVACGPKGDSKENDKKTNATEEVTEEADSEESYIEKATLKTEEGVVALIYAIYEDINTIYGPRDEDECEPNVGLVGQYLSKEFRELTDKIREIDANKAEGEGFDMSGDWSGLWHIWDPPFEVQNIDVIIDGDYGSVNYSLVKDGEGADMSYTVVYEDGQWRISDCYSIGMMTGSWIDRMNEYIEANQ